MTIEPFPRLADLLPHAPPALLLDALTALEDGRVECSARIGADFPYLRSGAAPALVLLELMAQATGACAHLAPGARSPRVGYVVGVRSARFLTGALAVGTEVRVRARPSGGTGSVGKFDCDVREGEELLAEAQLTVFQPEEP